MSAKKHRIYFRLQIAAHTLQKYADRLLMDAAGITTAQAAVLTIINSENNISQRDLAVMLQQNDSAITAMVSRLKDMKLLSRARSTLDKRVWVLKLTAKGEKALTAVNSPFATVNQHIEAAVGLSRLADFANALTSIANTPTKEH